jgi:hypothetical protein
MSSFLQDSKGNFSSMRLMFIVMIVNTIFMSWYTLVNESSIAALALFSGGVTVASGLKIFQNIQEK